MEYRLDTSTGKIYTEKEWIEEWVPSFGDSGVIGMTYDMLTPIEVEDGKLEETKKKMFFIYRKEVLYRGEVISHSDSGDLYVVMQHSEDGDIYAKNITTNHVVKWIGPYIKVISSSITDRMRPIQLQYNIVINNGSINNSNDSSVSPLNNVGDNDI